MPVAPAPASVSVVAKEPPSAPLKEPPGRRFLHVEGDVTIDGVTVAEGSEIPVKAKLHTGKGAKAVLTLEKGGVIEVRENTDVELGESPRHKLSLKLVAGILWSMLPKGKSDYEVITHNAVAGARGTTFFVNATDPKVSMVCVCDGDVELQAGSNKGKNIKTHDEHHGYAVSGHAKGSKAKLLGKLKDMPNHPNAEREKLRALLPN